MKKIFYSIALISSFVFTTSCEKEAEILPKEHPFVITLEPTVSNMGALQLHAKLLSYGTDQEIISYGFAWSIHNNPTIIDNAKIYEGNIEEGVFTYKLGALETKQTYHFRAFIQTEKYYIYGNDISFTKL